MLINQITRILPFSKILNLMKVRKNIDYFHHRILKNLYLYPIKYVSIISAF